MVLKVQMLVISVVEYLGENSMWVDDITRQSKYHKFRINACTRVTYKTLESIKYTLPKYLYFSKKMLDMGVKVYLYESKSSRSKYLFIVNSQDKYIKIRFSNHVERLQGNHYNVGPLGLNTRQIINIMEKHIG